LNNEEFDRFGRRPPVNMVYPRKGSRETIERRPPIRKAIQEREAEKQGIKTPEVYS
jgi:hypothetical protein